uniref:helix-turn-helix domain-containing protein n=1 Tax=Thaumasiovibrio subtropicus TaxID=1891207 RepID=UPI000B359BC5|nr:XRE family transcriptional regulator [Thaumasiovibrio subtropicus]
MKSNPLSALDAKMSPEALATAKDKAADMLLDIRLAELREITNLSQVEIAKAMGISQPSVANLEKPGKDLRLSSLKKYIEAAGGKLRIDVELPDGNHFGFPV